MLIIKQDRKRLESDLNSFEPAVREEALHGLLYLLERDRLDLPPLREVANMHCHTFFSFNGEGYSPTGLAWLARSHGIKLMGIVDFDTLAAVNEFLDVCDLLGIRASAGLETRVYLPEFARYEINSPGEPGVYYHMGIGFTRSQPPAEVAPILAAMQHRAEARNRAMLDRLNTHLAPLTIDYEADVLPLTPNGNATERHMLAAYLNKANRDISAPVTFWADRLDLRPGEVVALMNDQPRFQNVVRGKLMKRGGVGYVQPGPETFPTVEELHTLILGCEALPCATWLDGLSEGEQREEELLTLLIDKGVVALNIVPDRNWNITDPTLKARKVQELYNVVELAQKLDLPINVGTEMNSPGLKIVDDFDAEELAPVRDAFLDGAYFIYGHTIAQRKLGKGYQSDWAQTHFPTRRTRNAFYTNLGKQVAPGDIVALQRVIEAV